MKNNSAKKRLVLLDSHAILHRGYHALPDFATSAGKPTGALYGLCLMLLRIIEDFKPDYIVAAYDLPKPTYRHEVYKEYKAGRVKTDDDLISQIKESRRVFEAFGIPLYDKEGFEADDILGTIVEKTKKDKDIEIIIASGDMDTLQLVDDDKVRVFTLKKGIKDTILYNEKNVRERFGFGPELLPDYKGLRGDPSDNIPGIKGIGEKTATILITSFGGIEGIYKALAKDETKFADVKITPRIIELLKNGKDDAEFSRMLGTIRRDAPIDFELPKATFVDNIDFGRLDVLFTELEFRTIGARLRGILGKGGAPAAGAPESASEEIVDQKPIDGEKLKEAALMLWIVKSSITNPTLEDIFNHTNTKDFFEAYESLAKEIKEKNLTNVYEDIEKPLIPILNAMKETGVKIDVSALKDLKRDYEREIKSLVESIWKMSGEEFNVASPKQLGEVLFVKMGLKAKYQKKTSSGAFSTKESELEKLLGEHPIIEKILEYRQISKLLGTYIEPIPSLVDTKDRLHATFIQTGASTGRMSSENPNLQNIPNKSDRGKNIRRAFIAEKGFELLSLDYSQIELRVAAILSGDPKLLDIFRKGEDVHSAVASYVYGIPQNEVTKNQRREAKVINFGVMYGMGVNALRANLGTDRATAQKFLTDYFEKFSGLAAYLDDTKKEAASKGYTETLFGRRRYFEGLQSKIPFVRAASERMAINAPIQGTEADIVKMAMIKIDEFICAESLEKKVRLTMQVHDELVYEVEKGIAPTIVPKIKKIMESVVSPEISKGVVFTAEAKVGENWEEMDEVK